MWRTRQIIPSICLLIAGSLGLASSGCSTARPAAYDFIISNVRLYPGPDELPLDNVSIAVRDGRIAKIGPAISGTGKVHVDGAGRAATSGLWNSHVHFMDPTLKTDAIRIVHDMLLQYGFTHVLDTGSELAETLALAEQINGGTIAGPRIYTANGSFVYTDATPIYLPDYQLPEIADPADADAMVAAVMSTGAGGIKIFSGSLMSPTKVIHMPPAIILAVADATHRRGGFVVAHPSDRTGLVNAVENGVDILAHTTPGAKALGPELVASMQANNVALIPTLKLWSYELKRSGVPEKVVETVQKLAVTQLAEYYAAGGEILFGTDTGYMSDFDTRDEFMLMARAGMNFDAILASLTSNPAQRFSGESGRLEVGAVADIVVYADDPAEDVTRFSRVAYTIKEGQVVYCANSEDECSSELATRLDCCQGATNRMVNE